MRTPRIPLCLLLQAFTLRPSAMARRLSAAVASFPLWYGPLGIDKSTPCAPMGARSTLLHQSGRTRTSSAAFSSRARCRSSTRSSSSTSTPSLGLSLAFNRISPSLVPASSGVAIAAANVSSGGEDDSSRAATERRLARATIVTHGARDLVAAITHLPKMSKPEVVYFTLHRTIIRKPQNCPARALRRDETRRDETSRDETSRPCLAR